MVDKRDIIPATGRNGWEVRFEKITTSLHLRTKQTFVPNDSLGMTGAIVKALEEGYHVYINNYEVILDGKNYKYLDDF